MGPSDKPRFSKAASSIASAPSQPLRGGGAKKESAVSKACPLSPSRPRIFPERLLTKHRKP